MATKRRRDKLSRRFALPWGEPLESVVPVPRDFSHRCDSFDYASVHAISKMDEQYFTILQTCVLFFGLLFHGRCCFPDESHSGHHGPREMAAAQEVLACS